MGKIQIKTNLRFHFARVRIPAMKKTNGNKFPSVARCVEEEFLSSAGSSEEQDNHYKNQYDIPPKLKIKLPYDPV